MKKLVKWLSQRANARLRKIPNTVVEVNRGTWLQTLLWGWYLISSAPFICPVLILCRYNPKLWEDVESA